jgi:chemotaxis protein MotB
VSHDVGDRTAMVQSGRVAPRTRRPSRIAWVLLVITAAGGGTTGWWLYERGQLAGDEAADARARLAEANARAAEIETKLLELTATRLRGVEAPAGSPRAELDRLAGDLKGVLEATGATVHVDDAGARLTVAIDDPQMFRGDDDVLTPRGRTIVGTVGRVLGEAGDRPIWIHGHVDPSPLPDDAVFESHWELSSARALAVLRQLAEDDDLDARRMAVVAFGDQRPVTTTAGARNARIEIVVEPEAPAAAAARPASKRTR